MLWAIVLGLLAATASGSTIVPDEVVSHVLSRWITKDSRFNQVAQEVEKDGKTTDKVTKHSYQYVYDKYLKESAKTPLKLLEIGLGCGYSKGPGHSLELWTHFLAPGSSVSFVEYDAPCAKKFESYIESKSNGKLFIGDQADPELLNQILEYSKPFGGFDVLVDDGGHQSVQIITSFQTLWAAVKPGGIYVIEDINVAYFRNRHGWREQSAPETSISFVKRLIDNLNCRSQDAKWYTGHQDTYCKEHALDVLFVDCWPEICVIGKGLPKKYRE